MDDDVDDNDEAKMTHWIRLAQQVEALEASMTQPHTTETSNPWLIFGFVLTIIPAIVAMLLVKRFEMPWI